MGIFWLGVVDPKLIRIQNASSNQVIEFGLELDIPQRQGYTWFHHMKVNAHIQNFFSPFTCFFLLHCVKTRVLLLMHRHFFSPFTCIFLLHRVETALSMHTQTFVSPLPAFFFCITWASENLALLCIHWHFAVLHITFFETPTCAMISAVT